MRYTVTGRVHPERADIQFSRIEWQLQGGAGQWRSAIHRK